MKVLSCPVPEKIIEYNLTWDDIKSVEGVYKPDYVTHCLVESARVIVLGPNDCKFSHILYVKDDEALYSISDKWKNYFYRRVDEQIYLTVK